MDKQKEVVRVKLVDLSANTRVFEIPKFGARPLWISHQYKTFLYEAQADAYIERFGYPMLFNAEPVK